MSTQRIHNKNLARARFRKNHPTADKEYYHRNKERIAAQHKEYYERNRDWLAAYYKEYRNRNRDRIRAQHAEYRTRNQEKVRALGREWRKQNFEKISARNKKRYNEDWRWRIECNLKNDARRRSKILSSKIADKKTAPLPTTWQHFGEEQWRAIEKRMKPISGGTKSDAL